MSISSTGGWLCCAPSPPRIPDGTTEKSTKTHASRRIAFLTGRTVVCSERFARQSSEWADTAGAMLRPDSFVFGSTPDGGRPLHPEQRDGRIPSIVSACGVTGVRLHDLRHAHATQLLAAGVPLRTVSGRLGHANAVTTLYA